jgi:probable HAF family extracellular repeat protein
MRRNKMLLAGIVGLGLVPALAAADTTFSITGIAPVSGDNFSTAYAINNNGEIIGVSYDATIQPATGTTPGSVSITDENGFSFAGSTLTVLTPLGTSSKGISASIPVALNDSGEIVGGSTRSTPGLQGFTDIGGVVAAYAAGIPVGLNNSGVILGSSTTGGFVDNGSILNLSGLTTAEPPFALAINDSGVVAGGSATSAFTKTSPAVDLAEWPAGSATPTDLGGLPGRTVDVAFAINSGGDIAGFGLTPPIGAGGNTTTTINPTTQNGSILLGVPIGVTTITEASELSTGEAFIYSAKSGKITGLGDLGGGFSLAEAINSSDDIVGTSLDSSGDYHAFIDVNGVMTDLNSLIPATSGWDLINADGINNAGDIVGFGDNDGLLEAFELTPSGTISGTGGNGGTGGTGGTTGVTAVPLPTAAWSGVFLLASLATAAGIKARRRTGTI